MENTRGIEDVKLHHGNAINKISMKTATRQMICFVFFNKNTSIVVEVGEETGEKQRDGKKTYRLKET